MLNDFAIFDAKNVDDRPAPILLVSLGIEVKDHEVALGDDMWEDHVWFWVASEVALEILDERRDAVGNERIVLNILIADIQRCGLARLMLVESQS
jgi:hypothetical protein